ncbi:MAG: ComF family protein [Thermodesulfobacteriota bacterium]
MKLLLTAIRSCLFPACCVHCGEMLPWEDNGLCCDCLKQVTLLTPPLCTICGRGLPDSSGNSHACGVCLKDSPLYHSARAAALYKGPVKHLIHRLKYRGDTSVLPTLGQLIRNIDICLDHQRDRIIPVPLHLTRLRKRGLNQSLLLARQLFPNSGKTLLPKGLVRVRNTPPQTSLNGKSRRKNLRGAFAVPDPAVISGCRIILVDDVFTTGTTVTECSRQLLRSGAAEVDVVTVARVEK